ncbi:MAG: ABC transporter ATP-binding protein [Acidimicrobiia bacterium]|nr:ABC transporter ATP-binding protein [Acidimicrobiia bacterium]
MTAHAIEVDGLVKLFHPRGRPPLRAVDHLSFAVRPGSIFGLLGPNGAGKTTTLRVLTTLTRPTEGTARVAGFDVVASPLEVRRRIAVVIQQQAADLLLTVRDNLASYGRFHGLSGATLQARSARAIEQFGLEECAASKVQDLSGGFRRRVQVAKALMVSTPVLFLDEFSTGMDPLLKRSVMALLREESRAGRTIVLTTQVLTEAEELCDDILIINRGRQVARGDLHALKLLSGGVYELTLTFDEVPAGLAAEVAALGPLRMETTRTTLQVSLKEDEQQVLALVSRLAARGTVRRVEVSGASLEDVFVELTSLEEA